MLLAAVFSFLSPLYQQSPINDILDKEEFKLEELMQEAELLQEVKDDDTPLSFMGRMHPEVTEFDMRGELSSFGIGGGKVRMKIRIMSGGEVRLEE